MRAPRHQVMSSDRKMLQMAANAALEGQDRPRERRQFILGAVGIRNDGVLVKSRNLSAPLPAPDHHAETRLARKLTPGSTVWVARVSRKTWGWAMAKPCPGCERRLRAAGVERVIYTIGPDEFGTLIL